MESGRRLQDEPRSATRPKRVALNLATSAKTMKDPRERVAQDQWTQIASNLEYGIDCLLRGEVYKLDVRNGDELYDLDDDITPPDSEDEQQKEQQKKAEEKPATIRREMSGLPEWMRRPSAYRAEQYGQAVAELQRAQGIEAESKAEGGASSSESEASEAEQSEQSSDGSFMAYDRHDINDLVQEDNEEKKLNIIARSKKAAKEIMARTKEKERVEILEELNALLSSRSHMAAQEVDRMKQLEIDSKMAMAEQSEIVRQMRHNIERKEIKFFTDFNSYGKKMHRTIMAHLSKVQRRKLGMEKSMVDEEEEERAAQQQKIHDSSADVEARMQAMEAEINALKTSVDSSKSAEKKRKKMSRASESHAYAHAAEEPADAKPNDSKAAQVLRLVAEQQEELQALTAKLILANQHLELIQDARDRAPQYMESTKSGNSRGRANISEAVLELLEEVELKSKQACIAEHMDADPDLNELIWLAISTEVAKDANGFTKNKTGTVNLNTVFAEGEAEKREHSFSGRPKKFDADDADLLWKNLASEFELRYSHEDETEPIASLDPCEVTKEMNDLKVECAELSEQIKMLSKKKDQKKKDQPSRSKRLGLKHQAQVVMHITTSNAVEPLLQSIREALVALEQQKNAFAVWHQEDLLQGSQKETHAVPGLTGTVVKHQEDLLQKELHAIPGPTGTAVDEALQDEIEETKAEVSDLSMEANDLLRKVQILRVAVADPERASAKQKAESEAQAFRARIERRASKLLLQEEAASAEATQSLADKRGMAKESVVTASANTGSAKAKAAKAKAKANTQDHQTKQTGNPAAVALHSPGASAMKRALTKKQEENDEAKAKVEELKRLIEEARAKHAASEENEFEQQGDHGDSRSSSRHARLPSAAAASSSATSATAERQLGRVNGKDSIEEGEKETAELVEPSAEFQELAEPLSPGPSSRNRRRPSAAKVLTTGKTLKDLAREQKATEVNPEEAERQKKKLKENLQIMMSLGAEKEQLEKDLIAMEEKLKAVKSSSNDKVVEQLLKEVRKEKKHPESDRIKHLKSELKKGRGTVQKLRVAWQATTHGGQSGSKKKMGTAAPAEAQEAPAEVVNRFKSVLEALKPKTTEEVVAKHASIFLNKLRSGSIVDDAPQAPAVDVLQQPADSKIEVSAGLKAETSEPSSPTGGRRPSAAGFSRLMADMQTGRRPSSSMNVMTKRADLSAKISDPERDAATSPQSPGRPARGSMFNLIAKAKVTEHGESDDENGPDKPGAKASSTVRFLVNSRRPSSECEDRLDQTSAQPMPPEVITEGNEEQETTSSSSSSDSESNEEAAPESNEVAPQQSSEDVPASRQPVRRTTPGASALSEARIAAEANEELEEHEEELWSEKEVVDQEQHA
eukprot:TRINITY_DN3872_c0_g1_i6.p1 TRINITY_DN3872_c0_g1~~TRINITY_DN3872_c0_g1_i6.p1  ORF type:complete len:1380 (+),score=345.86 TRINITY_DN3872_c0_g1_i6:311-4450(+)